LKYVGCGFAKLGKNWGSQEEAANLVTKEKISPDYLPKLVDSRAIMLECGLNAMAPRDPMRENCFEAKEVLGEVDHLLPIEEAEDSLMVNGILPLHHDEMMGVAAGAKEVYSRDQGL